MSHGELFLERSELGDRLVEDPLHIRFSKNDWADLVRKFIYAECLRIRICHIEGKSLCDRSRFALQSVNEPI